MASLSRYLIIFCCFLSLQSIQAQQNDKDCACCTEAHDDFDFWIGKWTVRDPSGIQVGVNTISKLEENCLLQEKWEGEAGSTGTSINYYDPNDQQWHQTWISNTGTILKLSGGMVENSMVLKSELVDHPKGKYYNQITWTPNADGTVTQVWQLFKENGAPIQNIFKGIYSKE